MNKIKKLVDKHSLKLDVRDNPWELLSWPSAETAFDFCLKELKKCSIIKTQNRRHTTYGYKHYMERLGCCYVYERVFTLAAMEAGFTISDDSAYSARINISEKDVKRWDIDIRAKKDAEREARCLTRSR